MFPWHSENWDLPSISQLQEGEAKTWSVVPLEQRDDFEAFLNAHLNPMVPRAANGDVWKVLESKRVYFPTPMLTDSGFKVTSVLQGVGDFVITAPGAIHAGFHSGPNVASASNLACFCWLWFAETHLV